ncbi:nitrate reductase [Methylotenera mobilis]|uniref:Nitrate reductase n=1 Tax=Methylotenera mobilis TaxID=359408 RepID=A0A351RB58_9PROT|nr:nitrate reductase [Methylotenera mobilis]PPC95619.1 MAG: nitrate reductase [Methylotenera sp.]HBA09279.1 nitrate reductase [Methylotenera mobilis]
MIKQTKSTCCYCGVGCGVIIHSENDKIIDVKGDPQHPANFGRLCTKGSTLHLSAKLDNRLLYPEIRTNRDLPRKRATWDESLNLVVEKFATLIETHGPDSVAFYISGQLLTEDYYVFNKLAKGLIGTNNIDTNSRLCMSSAVAGYKLTLGADAPPACYEDIDHTDCLFIAGSNTAFAHPIIYRRIEDAKEKNPNLKIVVVDPRQTDTAKAADLHLAILPGTDVALFNGMLHVMLWEGMLDNAYIDAYTNGFAELKETVREYTPKMVADICGIKEADIITAAKWFGKGPTLSMYCQGLNQSVNGSDKNAALINLHLATGQIGKLGAGPFSLTGQPNAMGGREVGGMANLLSGHRDLANPEHRAEVASLWGIESVPDVPGKSAVDMFKAVKDGSIKAIWIACTNPAQSMPDLNEVLEALENAELVVVQDAFDNTETCQYADVLLPASTWGEKEGSVTNSERRITRVNPAVIPPAEARHDWAIVVDFAQRLEQRLAKNTKLFPYATTEQIFDEHRETTRGRDLDITGLSYTLLNEQGPQQWPFKTGDVTGKARLYADGVFQKPDGKAQFLNATYKGTADKTDARYPLHLLTGRLRDQWHGMSRTGNVAQLFNHAEEPVIHMSADDMMRRSIKNGDIVRVSNKRGSLVLPAQTSDEVKPSQTFIPMHWGSQYMHGLGVNALMPSAYDKVSKQPELKHTAIKLEKLELPWRMTVMRTIHNLEVLQKLKGFLSHFEYASCGLFGRETENHCGMLILRAAHTEAPDEQVIQDIDALLGMTGDAPLLNYLDAKRGISKRILVETNLENKAEVTGVRLVGETLAAAWLKDVMGTGEFSPELRRWALAPLSAPPAGQRSRGKIVCNCLDVAENEIIDNIQLGADLLTLQNKLKCGTQCGSCVPELKQLVRIHAKH